jgi:DNA-binding NarL/FixJ family response regulator
MQPIGKLKIILVDTHVLFRKGLKAILSDYTDFTVVSDFSNWNECIPNLLTEKVDIIIIDTDFSKFAKEEFPIFFKENNLHTKILALTLANSKKEVLSAIQTGINGYLLKNEEIDVLVQNLKRLHQGKFVVSDDLVEQIVQLIKVKNDFPFQYFLSERELDVLKLVNSGSSNKQISQSLFISENTVKTHIKHLFKKFSVNNRKDVVEKAKYWGIIN